MTQTNLDSSFKATFKKAAFTTALAIGAFQIGVALPAVVDAQAATTKSSSQLNLNITGYDVQEGQIMVALYANEENFNEEAKPYRDAKIRVNGPETLIVFTNLSAGEYAFKIFHDENGNSKLDTDMLGIPSEAYIFSNDASDPFSAPEWQESKFILPIGKITRNLSFN
jgi:uncharacterized protein (DUF2141 family)